MDQASDACGWSLVLDDLLSLQAEGLQPTAPEAVSRLFISRSTEDLRSALQRLPPPAGSISLEFTVPTPFWRLSASYPDEFGENGGSSCTLRASCTATSSRQNTSVEIFATGEMGRLASTLVSRAANGKLSEMRRTGPIGFAESVLAISDWIENTELLELAASMGAPAPPGGSNIGRIRAFVRFHHVLGPMKRAYMRLWAEDLAVGSILAVGQPAMLLVEGDADGVRAFVDRVTKLVHWGPTPSMLVASSVVGDADGVPLQVGTKEVLDLFPETVTPNGTYNGRHSTDYNALATALLKAGHTGAAEELRVLSSSAFAHRDGRVAEAEDGTGWVGYAMPPAELAQPRAAESVKEAAPKRRWGKKS